MSTNAPMLDTAPAMSDENVEVVKAHAEAYSAGVDAFVDFLVDFMAKDVEIVPDASRFPDAKPFRGREEYRRYISDIDRGWEGGARYEIKEIFPVGEDRVVSRGDWRGKGQSSGIDLRSSLSLITTVRDGQITKLEYFFDHKQALEAAGLSE